MIIIPIRGGDVMRYLKANGGRYRNIGVDSLNYRFVVVGDDVILGDVSQHINLMAIHDLGQTPELVSAFRGRGEDKLDPAVKEGLLQKYDGKILAAGIVDGSTGTVDDWKSVGFNVITPEQFRESLQQLIRTIIPSNGWLRKNWP
jgi:hypothetical protein